MKSQNIVITFACLLSACSTANNFNSVETDTAPAAIDLIRHIGSSEKDAVSLITKKSGTPIQYVPLDGGACYFWKNFNGSHSGLMALFKNGKLHSYTNGIMCPSVRDVGTPVKVDF